MKTGFVYIMTNRAGTLYIGVTNDLIRRVIEHKTGRTPGFTARYRMTQLVYYESTEDIRDAIAREKQLKGWTRRRKVELIDAMNPYWFDLSDGLTGEPSTRSCAACAPPALV
jgi:putative endonuclease